MKDRLNSISALWKSKEQDIKQCSKKAVDFLLLLKQQNGDLFSKWYKKGKTKKEALEVPIDITEEYFTYLLLDKLDEENPDLGSRVSFWTGHKDEKNAAEISFNLGAFGDKSYNKNSCVLTLPSKVGSFYQTKENRDNLIRLVFSYWEPERFLLNGDLIEKTCEI